MSGIKRTIPTDQYLAALNANSPNGVNAFATLADVLVTGGGNQIISGTAAYSGVGLTYDVSTLVYTIQGTLYTSAPTSVTLAAADLTFDRIDVIYVDDLMNVGVLTGTPSASPVKPQVDNLTQVEVTFITVPAGATSPGTTVELVYNENVGTGSGEWNATATASVLLNSTADPYNGTTHIGTTASFGSNKNITFTPAAPYTIAGGLLTFWLKAKSNMSIASGKFLVGFYVGGSLVGNSVTIGGTPSATFGFSGSVIGTYQLVTIPISAFGGLPANVDDLRFFTLGGANSAEFDLDYIRILEGVATPPAPIAGHAIEDEGVALTQRPTIDFQGDGVTATDDPLNDKTVVTIPGVPNLNVDAQIIGDIGGNTTIQHNLRASLPPAPGDDSGDGYVPGSVWVDRVADKAYICLDASLGAAVWTEITQAGGGGGGGWNPTGITLGDVVANGATAALAVGAGYYYSFDASSDDEIVINIGLARNGVAYDGSSVRLDLHNMLVGAGGAGDTVLWEVDYAWTNNGDNAYTAVDGTVTNSVTVNGRASQILFTDSLTIPAGTAGDDILQLTIRRNSQGGGSDSFGGSVEIYALDLVKI